LTPLQSVVVNMDHGPRQDIMSNAGAVTQRCYHTRHCFGRLSGICLDSISPATKLQCCSFLILWEETGKEIARPRWLACAGCW
jgi:hypothetical protein